jgi:hypothetical protein
VSWPKLGGNDVELLAALLADDVKIAATARAGLCLRLDDDLLARQVLGQGAPVGLAWRGPALAARCPRFRRRLRRLGGDLQA